MVVVAVVLSYLEYEGICRGSGPRIYTKEGKQTYLLRL